MGLVLNGGRGADPTNPFSPAGALIDLATETIGTVAPSGPASGDLAGTYPGPTVTRARGLKSATTTVSVSGATAPSVDQVLTATSSTAATWQTISSGSTDDLTFEINADATIANEDPALILTGGTGAAIVSTDFTQDSSLGRVYVTHRLSSIAVGNTERSTELVIGPLSEVDNINDDVDATLRFRGHTASLAVDSFRESTISLNAGLGRMQYNAASLGGAPKHQFQIAGVDILNLESNLIELRKNTRTIDNVSFNVGTSDDFSVIHASATDDTTISQNNALGDLIIDNTSTGATDGGATIIRLGTDTITTKFEVQNNSESTLFSVLGDGSSTFSGDLFATKLIGGSATTSDLTLQTTSAAGITGADMHFLVGNNGATEAMTILNNGNVGIGFTNPNHDLDIRKTVSGNPVKVRIRNDSATAGSSGARLSLETGSASDAFILFDINGGTQGWALGGDASDGNKFKISDGASLGTNDRFVIDSSGNVGIGTTPDELFHTAKAVDGEAILLLLENSQANTGGSTNETAELRWGFGDNNDVARIVVGKEQDYTSSANEDSFLAFYTDLDGTVAERMRIGSSGRVGIANAAGVGPQYRLDVGNLSYFAINGNFAHIIQHNSAAPTFWSIAPRNGGDLDIAVTTTDPRPTSNTIGTSDNAISIKADKSVDFLGALKTSNLQDYGQISAPSVSASNEARIYFDSTSKKLRVSENAGAFVDLISVVKGTIDIGDVGGNPTGPLTVTGDLTSANKSNSGAASTIAVVYPNMGNPPIVSMMIESTSAAKDASNDLEEPIILNVTSTGLDIYLFETGSTGQDVKAHLILHDVA